MALTVVFLAGLAVPCVGTFLGLDTGGFPGENRAAAAPPDLADGNFQEFPARVEAWVNDHFGLRNTFVGLYSRIAFRLLKVSISDNVVIGKGGWLFFTGERIVPSHRGVRPLQSEELRMWQALFESRQVWLFKRAIRYVLVVAPEKSSIYPELMPDILKPVGTQTRTDQFVEHMRRYSTVDVLDLREGLRRAKPEGRLFQLTDTHWTDLGAFAAYRQIAAFIGERYPGLRPLERSDFECRTVVGPGGDLSRMLGMSRWLNEERLILEPLWGWNAREVPMTALMAQRKFQPNRRPLVKECPDAPVGKAVVIRDSFFMQVEPFFSEHFRRTVYLWNQFDPEVVGEEQPDLVVEQIVERVLNRDIVRPR